MKKTLVALAALASISAFAQSTVEIYGIMDVGYGSHKIDVGGFAAEDQSNSFNKTGQKYGLAGDAKTAATQRKGFASGGQSTSRLGFRGTEDLGGGTKAGFTFEISLTPAGTASGVPSAQNGDNTLSTFNNRQAFVSLGSEKTGTVAIGRQYTPAHIIQTSYNAGGSNNVVGDVTYTQPEVGATAPTNGFSGLRADALSGAAYAIRASNAISYALPQFVPGLTTALAYAASSTTNNGTEVSSKGWTGLAKYDNGPLSFGASTLKLTVRNNTVATVADGAGYNTGTGAATTNGAGVSGVTNAYVGNPLYWANGSTQADDTKVTNNVYAVSYAVANANVFYTNILLKAEQGAGESKRTANKVGVNATFGNWVPFAQYGTAKTTSTDMGDVSLKNKGYQVGTSYNFSKRTNAYAIYGSNKLTAEGAAINEGKETQYVIGMRHQF